MDVCAAGLKAAAAMMEDGQLEAARDARYAGWNETDMLTSGTLDSIAASVEAEDINPAPRSGKQEKLENLVNRYL